VSSCEMSANIYR